jgi:hypothetical protein
LHLELDECCYSYASIPRNDTFCIPDGEQVNLNCAIINPHDNFTNLTVTWFRSTTENMSIFDEIPSTSEEYRFSAIVSNRADNALSLINCSHVLYRDSFSLIILHFTRHKNGYYWCQLTINNTLAQPSQRSQFFVGECNTINLYYRLANFNLNENQCAKYVAESDAALTTTTYEASGTPSVVSSTESARSSSVTQQERENVATESDTGLTTTNGTPGPGTSVANSSTESSSSVTQQERESDKTIIRVAGIFSALLLIALLGVLGLAFSFAFYAHHQRKKTSKLHGSIYKIIPDKLNFL